MRAGTILLLRHGRTAYNAEGRLQGQVDIPLDDVGRWQAGQGAAALAATHRVTRIVASDLVRAADTAAVLGEAAGVPVTLDARVRERGFGPWEGLTAAEMREGWPDEYTAWRHGGEPVDGAEPRRAVADRFVEAVDEHAAGLTRDDVLCVVSHGAAISTGTTALLGLDVDAWRGIVGLTNVHWAELRAGGAGATPAWRLVRYDVGASFSRDEWTSGPDWISRQGSA
ncbi:histidine phosphatase family protein [Sanguibacter sp. A247]|uniref:histidine phosphatase family protein n=1 Tax=unclassified Sanguibacter TaxID=2645534 RepID=UPI003FD6D882